MAITIATSVIVIAVLLYSFWDSIDYLKGVNKYLGSFIVIAGLAAWIVSERVETLQAVADGTNAKEGERKSRLLEERIKSRSELLDSERKAKLPERLKSLPAGEFLLATNDNAPENREFGDTLASVMEEAGCDMKRQHAAISVAPVGRSLNGIIVMYRDDPPPALATALYLALLEAGVTEVSLERWATIVDEVEVYVGARSNVPIDELRARAEKAESETLSLKKRFAPRTELLTPEVQLELAKVANSLPAASIHMSALTTTSEAVEFAEALARIFNNAGRLKEVSSTIAGGNPFGVVIYHSPGDSVGAQLIATCLQKAAVPDVEVVASSQKYEDGRAAYISVGAKR